MPTVNLVLAVGCRFSILYYPISTTFENESNLDNNDTTS